MWPLAGLETSPAAGFGRSSPGTPPGAAAHLPRPDCDGGRAGEARAGCSRQRDPARSAAAAPARRRCSPAGRRRLGGATGGVVGCARVWRGKGRCELQQGSLASSGGKGKKWRRRPCSCSAEAWLCAGGETSSHGITQRDERGRAVALTRGNANWRACMRETPRGRSAWPVPARRSSWTWRT
jgi:hypothetical protein